MENEGDFLMNWPEVPEIWKGLLYRARGSISELFCGPEQAAAGTQVQPCRPRHVGHGAWLWTELGGSTLSLPASQECRSSPGQAWGHQAAPGVTTADAHLGLGSHQHPPELPSPCSSGEQTHSPGAGITSPLAACTQQHPPTFGGTWGSL